MNVEPSLHRSKTRRETCKHSIVIRSRSVNAVAHQLMVPLLHCAAPGAIPGPAGSMCSMYVGVVWFTRVAFAHKRLARMAAAPMQSLFPFFFCFIFSCVSDASSGRMGWPPPNHHSQPASAGIQENAQAVQFLPSFPA